MNDIATTTREVEARARAEVRRLFGGGAGADEVTEAVDSRPAIEPSLDEARQPIDRPGAARRDDGRTTAAGPTTR